MSAQRSPVTVSALVVLLLSTGFGVAAAGENTESAGDALQLILPGASASIALGHADGEGLGQFVKSAALTLGVTHGLKYAVDAERPNGGDRSFPSGHSSIAFCSAEFLRRRYGWGWGVPAYAAASFVAYSRVEAEQHYFRDVAAGALIGVAACAIFTRELETVSLAIAARPDGLTVAIGCRW